MASSSGSMSSTQMAPSSGAEDPMDQRRRKRKQSNRESARRSRQRKQQQLDELTTLVGRLRSENQHMHAALGLTTQRYAAVESHNSVLRTQTAELSARLHSLLGILNYINGLTSTIAANNSDAIYNYSNDCLNDGLDMIDELFNDNWSTVYATQPIMASAHMFQYC